MTSVERIHQYSKLEQEAADYTELQPPKDWPEEGNIELKNVALKYSGFDNLALGPLSFKIAGGEKVCYKCEIISAHFTPLIKGIPR